MKNFIKTVFAVLFGNIIFFGFFFLAIILMIIGVSMNSEKDTIKIKSNSILRLDLNGPLSDMSQNQDFKFNSFNQNKDDKYSIHELIAAIEQAGNDNNIQAMIIPMNMNSEISYAQVDLLRKALRKFKESKKPIIAYGEMASQKMYYLSTLADKIYINPNGGIDLRGFGAQLSFFKSMLDKLEIQPQIFYAGKYKSATEPFRLSKMSEENKIQIRELLQDISDGVMANIAKDRKLNIADVQSAINTMQSNIPHDALAAKLIDGEKYMDEVEDELSNLLKKDKGSKLEYTTIAQYIDDISDEPKDGKLAVYIAEGDIIDGKSNENAIGSETMVKDLRKIKEDNEIKGVVVRVNSPGGSALASAIILREIELLRKKKPVVISMGNLAASGGYYIASSAEKVFAEPNTITGSIGVFGIIPNVSKLMENKLGITFDEVELNDHAVVGITKELDPLESSKIQLEIDHIYQIFKSVVSKGRKLPIERVEEIAQGRVWSGEKAKSLGLVDEIGDLSDAIKYTAKLAKTDADDYRFYNRRKSDFERIIEDMTAESLASFVREKLVKTCLGEYGSYFRELVKYTEMKGIQARMLYEVEI